MNEPTATAAPIPMAAGTHAGAVVAARTVAAPAAAAEAAILPPAAEIPPPIVSFATLAANSPPSISPLASWMVEDTASIPPEMTAPAAPEDAATRPRDCAVIFPAAIPMV